MSTWTYMNIKGQSFIDLGPRSLRFNIFKLLFLRNPEVKFHVEPPWYGRTKVRSNGPGHMTNIWPPCPYIVKALKKSSVEPKGRWPCKLVCSNGYSSTTKLFKLWPWFDRDLFYGKVKFGPLCFFVLENGKTMDFSETIEVYQIRG